MKNCTLLHLTNEVRKFDIHSENIIVKPNWVSNGEGEYTEAEILDALLSAFPTQKIILVESYTPWRGLKFVETDNQKGEGVTLEGGKMHWDFYKKQDKFYFKETGIDKIISKHRADYVNITNEFWSANCVDAQIIKDLLEKEGRSVKWTELYSFIPNILFNIRNSSTIISLAKIKTEISYPTILISMSVKNLFGLIPHPSRWIPFHGKKHETIPEVIKDIYTIYTTLFKNNLWIAEGILSMIEDYEGPNHKVLKNQQLLFIGNNGKVVDSEAADFLGVDSSKIEHLQLIR